MKCNFDQYREINKQNIKKSIQANWKMSTFDQGFNYEIIYQVGGLRGWYLYVDGCELNDKYASNAICVALHRTSKSKFMLKQFNDGSYYLKVANGQFQGWFLSYRPHQTRKNVFLLVITPDKNDSCYWYFDQIKGAVYDNGKIIIRNYQNGCFIGANGPGWKRNQHSLYVYVYGKNKVGDSWAAWRIQASGGTSQAQSTIQSQQEQIKQLKSSNAKLHNQITYLTAQTQKLRDQVSNNRSYFQNQIQVLQSKLLIQVKLCNDLSAKNNQLIEAKRLYDQFKDYNKKQVEDLKNQNEMLQREKQIIINSREQAENQIVDIKNLQARIHEKEQECTLLKQLITKMQKQKQQFKQQFIPYWQTHIKQKQNLEEQLKLQTERTKTLVQKISQMKNNIKKLVMKSFYFKYLYQQQANKELYNKAIGGLLGLNNKDNHLENQNFRLRNRIQNLQNILLENHIDFQSQNHRQVQRKQEEKNTPFFSKLFNNSNKKEQTINLNEKLDLQQRQPIHKQQQQNQQISQLRQKNTNAFSVKDRAERKLLVANYNDLLLMKLDDLDQNFQTFYILKQKVETKKMKSQLQINKNQNNIFFQTKLCHRKLQIIKNKVTNKINDLKPRLAFCKQFLQQSNDLSAHILEDSNMIGVGIYNVKKVLQNTPQQIGTFLPQQHNFYLLFSDGKFIYNDGITLGKEFSNLKFTDGDIVNFRFDKITKLINFEIVGKNRKSINFKINFWEDQCYKFAFLMVGKECAVEVSHNMSQFENILKNQNNKLNEGKNQKQQNIRHNDINEKYLTCSNNHSLVKNPSLGANFCDICNDFVKQNGYFYCCQVSNCKRRKICEQCYISLQTKIIKLDQINKKCEKCEQLMQVNYKQTYLCNKCNKIYNNSYKFPSLKCYKCIISNCYVCLDQQK